MKRIIITLMLLMCVAVGWSQKRGPMQERIKAQKVAFITERLNLTAEEAQNFWPIYNAFEAATNKMRSNDLKEVRQAMRRGNLTDAEANGLLDTFMAVEDKLHTAKKQLVEDLKGVLPAQKIIQLKTAEDAFNRKLLDILERRKEQMQNRQNRKNKP